MNQKQQNNEAVGIGANAQGKPVKENDSRDYGKYVIIATLVVLFAAAVVMALI